MPGIQKLHLEDALEESPQMRSLLGLFEKDSIMLRDYVTSLHSCCARICNAQQELSSATQGLSNLLKGFENQGFPLGNDDTILVETLQKFSSQLDELSSYHQILATQLGDSTLFPLARFLQADLNEIVALSENYKFSVREHEAAILRYSKLSKKKETDPARQEANEDVFVFRKRFHQNALHYYTALNLLQYKRKMALLEPMIGYMHAMKSYFLNAQSVTVGTEVDDFLSNTGASIMGVQDELQLETSKMVAMVKDIEFKSEYRYRPELAPGLSDIPPHTTACQKSGYLFLRSKMVLSSKWDRHYFFIQAGNLMMQQKDEVAGSLVLDLNEDGVFAELFDSDDRRYVFQVYSPTSKKTVILQAENERERVEWISTIVNVTKSADYTRDPIQTAPQPEQKRASISKEDHSGSLTSTAPIAVPPANLARLVPSTPPSTPQEGYIPEAPIQFDILSPNIGERVSFLPESGQPRRINPFDHKSSSVAMMEGTSSEGASPAQTYLVRFLGCVEVRSHRGEQLIFECIRQILAARAINNIFKTTEYYLMISDDSMKLINPSDFTVGTEYNLTDVSCWASHKENKRLFGFILRDRSLSAASKARFICHVFESDTSGEDICHTIRVTADIAFQKLIEKKAAERRKQDEKNILLSNIDKLPDRDAPLLTNDGKMLLDPVEDLVVALPPLENSNLSAASSPSPVHTPGSGTVEYESDA